MKGMSTYIWRITSLSLLLSFFSYSALATNPKEEKEQSENGKKTLYGIYVDYDLGDLLLNAIESQRFGMNASVELDLMHFIYPAFEVGFESYDSAPDYSYNNTSGDEKSSGVKYDVDGMYYKVGANLNLLAKDYSKPLTPYAYVGARYAIAPNYKYEISGFSTNSSYWPGQELLERQKGNTTAQWAEFIAGVSTPIYKGLCLGVEIRFKQFLYIESVDEGDFTIHQSYVPGYGDKDDGLWSFRYTISYFFR